MDNKNNTNQSTKQNQNTQINQGQVDFDRNKKTPGSHKNKKNVDSRRIYIVTAILCALILIVILAIIIVIYSAGNKESGKGGNTTTTTETTAAPIEQIAESKNDDMNLVVVNDANPFDVESIKDKVKSLDEKKGNYKVAINDLYLQETALNSFVSMMEKLTNENNNFKDVQILKTGAYNKKEGDNNNLGEYGTGLALKLNVLSSTDGNTYKLVNKVEIYNWLKNNAAAYGWIWTGDAENYTSFRFVGVGHAAKMKEKNFTSVEEYVNFIKTNHNNFSTALDLGSGIKTYFVAKSLDGTTKFYTDANKDAFVTSTDGGYIITIKPKI